MDERATAAEVSCVEGCECATERINAHQEFRHSTMGTYKMRGVSQSPKCMLQLKVRIQQVGSLARGHHWAQAKHPAEVPSLTPTGLAHELMIAAAFLFADPG
jgi:hypothetical protein